MARIKIIRAKKALTALELEERRAKQRAYYAQNREYMRSRAKAYRQRTQKKYDNTNEKKRIKDLRETPEGWVRMNIIHARHRAKKKGMLFNIEACDIHLPDRCPVLGIKLVAGTGRNPRRNFSSPTLDRVNNDLGYVKGNVRVISCRANSLKSNASIEELEAVLNYMKAAASA